MWETWFWLESLTLILRLEFKVYKVFFSVETSRFFTNQKVENLMAMSVYPEYQYRDSSEKE